MLNSLPKTVTRQRRGCDLNPGPPATESSTLTTQLSSHPMLVVRDFSPCVNAVTLLGIRKKVRAYAEHCWMDRCE